MYISIISVNFLLFCKNKMATYKVHVSFDYNGSFYFYRKKKPNPDSHRSNVVSIVQIFGEDLNNTLKILWPLAASVQSY